MRLHLTTTQNDQLRAYLFDTSERVAFLFAALADGGHDAHVAELWLLDEHDYQHTNRYGVELAEHVRPQLIRTAHQHEYAVIEAHAHDWPGRHTRFSTTDLDGLSELGPHMTWRLRGRPYTALVFGQDSFDALQWHSTGEVTTVDALVIDGKPVGPTALSLTRVSDRMSRR